jgi:uncharacterized UPF0160 family protein
VQTLFAKAVVVAGEEFESAVRYYGQAWLPARQLVAEGLRTRHAVDPSGRIVRLAEACPWKDHLFTLETELGLPETDTVLYMLYDGGDSWRVQAVPPSLSTFASRKPLPAAWRGLRDDALSRAAGVDGCVFVRTCTRARGAAARAERDTDGADGPPDATGFIGGTRTYEAALALARAAVAASM